MESVLLTGAFAYTPEELQRIEQLGFTVDFLQYEKDSVKNPEKYACVVCNGLFLHHDIRQFAGVKMLQLTSAGTDRVPVDYLTEHGIRLLHAKDVYHIPMAEWAVLKTLELYKQSRAFYVNQNRHIWEKQRDLLELTDKKVCIVGMGSVGKAVAKRFKAFDTKITGLDIVPTECPYIDEFLHTEQLFAAVGDSDIIVLAVPYTAETHHLVNREILAAMPKNAILINLSRGSVIDELALIEALQAGHLSGAALDVFEEEPLSMDSPLWDLDNVIVTPHNAFVSDKTRERLYALIYRNLKDFRDSIRLDG